MNNDAISDIIDTLLLILKDSSMVITSNEKYNLWIQKVNDDTTGRTYTIKIKEPNRNIFGGEDNE